METKMIIRIKDAVKLTGVLIISCCAVLVCTLFINYYLDIMSIENELLSEQQIIFYRAQLSTAKIVCAVSGGCLLMTSVIMLLFYIKHYIDTHKKELGILKALGYSNIKIAKNFWLFGGSILAGTALGYALAFFIMPSFYKTQNKDHFLPEIPIGFHPSVFLYFVIIPTVAFAMLSVWYAWHKLKTPVLRLLKEVPRDSRIRKHTNTRKNRSFLNEVKIHTLKDKKVLVFFITFASFCFSSMTQMSLSMKDLSSIMMAGMILLIGMILSFTTLFLAITTVIRGNTKTIAMMRIFGYSQKECCNAILGGYRPTAYIGFFLGTGYQYALLRIMVDIVFQDFADIPVYRFDFRAMMTSLIVFIVVYEITMHVYAEKIKSISVKEIMIE